MQSKESPFLPLLCDTMTSFIHRNAIRYKGTYNQYVPNQKNAIDAYFQKVNNPLVDRMD